MHTSAKRTLSPSLMSVLIPSPTSPATVATEAEEVKETVMLTHEIQYRSMRPC